MHKVIVAVVLLVVLGLTSPTLAFLRKRYIAPNIAEANEAIAQMVAEKGRNEPLFLTPYITSGKLKEGRELSEVRQLPGLEANQHHPKSFSGYLTVNKEHNSNLFFWFFPPLHGRVDDNTPVVLWLQGGPGAPSMFGLLVENGPLRVTPDGRHLTRANHSWNEQFAVLYVDQPVGTGFSFTDSDKGYVKNEEEVGRDLYEALRQFFTLYEDYRGNPFYVTGESYAGKYIPAIAHRIHREGHHARQAGINLAGLAIGDGWCDPANMANYGDYLYQVGLIDAVQRDHFYVEQARFATAVHEHRFVEAFQVMDHLMDGDLTPGGHSYLKNVTGLTDYYNILFQKEPEDTTYFATYLGLKEVRNAIHVGYRNFSDGAEVEKHLIADVMDTVRPWVEELLDADYPVLFYSGQLDLIVAAPLTENFLRRMHWKRSAEYNHSHRIIWKLGKKKQHVAGYVRHAANMVYVVLRNSGHMVPYDQPEVAHQMITRFITSKSFE